jgi:hypothetical protein
MISILYPLGPGSAWNNRELRFSLRSLEFIKDLESVFVVGSNPGFLSEQVTFIPTYHNFPNPARGIFENLIAACQDERTPERFALINDDYFFCGEVELSSYAPYHLGPISDTLKKCSSEYYTHLFTTQQELVKRGLPTLNFDSHFPIVLEKSKVLKLAEIYDWDRMHGLTFKSTYCNTFGISGEFRPDCKVNAPHGLEWWLGYVSERECFSIGDMALNGGGLIEFLQKVFPEKSIFEI